MKPCTLVVLDPRQILETGPHITLYATLRMPTFVIGMPKLTYMNAI